MWTEGSERPAVRMNEGLQQPPTDASDEDPEKVHDLEVLRRLKQVFINARSDLPIWPFLVLLCFGCIASVIGYVGCFSVVQSSRTTTGPLLWFILEAALSIMRMVIWAWNPYAERNFPPTITLAFQFSTNVPPVSACSKLPDEGDSEKALPLVRPERFLEDLGAYAGGLMPLHSVPESMSMYYTLTSATLPDSKPRMELYITLFEPSERTTRVFCCSNGQPVLYRADPIRPGTTSSSLKTTIRERVEGSEWNHDIIGKFPWLMDCLTAHYAELDVILRTRDQRSEMRIEIPWTLQAEDTTIFNTRGEVVRFGIRTLLQRETATSLKSPSENRLGAE